MCSVTLSMAKQMLSTARSWVGASRCAMLLSNRPTTYCNGVKGPKRVQQPYFGQDGGDDPKDNEAAHQPGG